MYKKGCVVIHFTGVFLKLHTHKKRINLNSKWGSINPLLDPPLGNNIILMFHSFLVVRIIGIFTI